jgi:hypothetical protein
MDEELRRAAAAVEAALEYLVRQDAEPELRKELLVAGLTVIRARHQLMGSPKRAA